MALCWDQSVEWVTLGDFPQYVAPAETGKTFEENALAKARAAHSSLNLPTLAEDSGLEVPGLGFRPGIYSARFGGEGLDDRGRCEALLKAVTGLRGASRACRFVCVAAWVEEGQEILCRGETAGVLTLEPQGNGGFGYDPLFWSPSLGKTFGESTAQEKESVSHRQRALKALRTEMDRVKTQKSHNKL